MTEAEWLEDWNYRRMYDLVRGRNTTRRVRLYMVTCCRLKAIEFFDARISRAVEVAELCADDAQAEAVVSAFSDELASSSSIIEVPQDGREGELVRVIMDAWRLLMRRFGPACNVPDAIADAAFLSLRGSPCEIFSGDGGNAAEHCAWAIDNVESLQMGLQPVDWAETETRRAIADLLRDIFGNPFRPVAIDPAWRAWNDGTVVKLAQTIYDERELPSGHLDAGRLAILADALEEAGCSNADILSHCRTPGPHVRGCWVVDLLLGKE